MTSSYRSEMQERLFTATAGQLCIQLWLGYGSVLFLGFGDCVLPRENHDSKHPIPDYELRTDEAEWTLHCDGITQSNRFDHPDRSTTEHDLNEVLVGQPVVEAKVLSDRLDLLIRFANSASLTVAPETDPESRSEDAWLIRFPTGIYYIAKCDGQTHQWPD